MAAKTVKLLGALVVVGAIGAGAFLYITRPQPRPEEFWAAAGTPDVKNGELIFSMGGCVSCHKAPKAEGEQSLVLAGGLALFRAFDTVVDGIADHVRQRFGELVDDRLVDFGVFTFRDEADRLADHVGDFANDTRHALEDRLHRLRADRHDRVLDLAGELLQLLQTHIDGRSPGRVVLDDALRQHRLVDDQLADEVDQTVDAVEIDADGLTCTGRSVRGIGGRSGCGCSLAFLLVRTGGGSRHF